MKYRSITIVDLGTCIVTVWRHESKLTWGPNEEVMGLLKSMSTDTPKQIAKALNMIPGLARYEMHDPREVEPNVKFGAEALADWED